MLKKNQVFTKTVQVGSATMVSRILGIVRERLLSEYLGVGIFADAFLMAFKIPNSLRKIFAEGSLTVSFIPTFVALAQADKKKEINQLVALSFLLIEGFLLIICIVAFFHADFILRLAAPGWFQAGWFGGAPTTQAAYAISYLRILLPFILFLSSSSLLAGVLQSIGHFFVPAFSPALLNVVFIAATWICMTWQLPVEYLSAFVVGGSLIQFFAHLVAYIRYGFGLDHIDQATRQRFKQVMKKFIPSFISMSVKEFHFFIDTSLASFLPVGSVAQIYYADRFGNIPHGVLAIAFSTILLPYFSSISVKAPERLSFYLYESAKLIFFVMVPITLFMLCFSQLLLSTVFLSATFTSDRIADTALILNAFLIGLLFFSLNKILFNIFYALHDTVLPLYISIFSLFLNFSLSYYVFMPRFGAMGIALATSCSAAAQSLLAAYILHIHYSFTLYLKRFGRFFIRLLIQTLLTSLLFCILYQASLWTVSHSSFTIYQFLTGRLGIWIWLGPLLGASGYFMIYTRRYFGIHLYFVD